MKTILAALDNSLAGRSVLATASTLATLLDARRRGVTRADGRRPHRARYDRRRRHCAAHDHRARRRAPRRGRQASDVVALAIGARGTPASPRPLGGTALGRRHRTAQAGLIVPPDADPPAGVPARARPARGSALDLAGAALARSSSRPRAESTWSHCTSTTRTPFPPLPTSRSTSMPAWTREFIHRYCPWGIGDVQLETRVGRIGELIPVVAEQCGCDLIALGWSQELASARASVVRETLRARSCRFSSFPCSVRPTSKRRSWLRRPAIGSTSRGDGASSRRRARTVLLIGRGGQPAD